MSLIIQRAKLYYCYALEYYRVYNYLHDSNDIKGMKRGANDNDDITKGYNMILSQTDVHTHTNPPMRRRRDQRQHVRVPSQQFWGENYRRLHIVTTGTQKVSSL